MPERIEVTEHYWCRNWKKFFRCSRTTTKWCYNFSFLTRTGYFLACKYVGCENGQRYEWTQLCFGFVGTREIGEKQVCKKNEMNSQGTC